MKERILAFLKERDALIEELKTILPWCDESPIIDCLDKEWYVIKDELRLGSGEDCCYYYEISSIGALGEQLFMGEKDGITYIMCHDGDWENTEILMLDNKNLGEYEQ